MFKPSDYLFTPGDFRDIAKESYHLVTRASRRDWTGVALLAAAALLFGLLTGLSPDEIFFWLFIITIFYWNLDSRISIGCALAGLIIIPLLLSLYQINILFFGDVWAERVAVWVYFFLCIGVLKQVLELAFAGRMQRNSLKSNGKTTAVIGKEGKSNTKAAKRISLSPEFKRQELYAARRKPAPRPQGRKKTKKFL